VAIFDYNIILSGYDVQTVNIRDHLYFGLLPRTGTTGDLLVTPPGDPLADGPVSPGHNGHTYPFLDLGQGTNAIQTANRCRPTDQFPGYPDYPQIPQASLDLLRLWLQYSQTFDKLHDATCSGSAAPIGDWFDLRNEGDVTWMYITADVVWNCNLLFPDQANAQAYWYFNTSDPDWINMYGWSAALDNGQKRVRNVLMGDVFWLNDALNFSEASHAVHLEADPYIGNVVTWTPDLLNPGPASFYYRYSTNVQLPSDYREPLPTAWAFRYIGWQSNAFDTFIRAFKAGFQSLTVEDLIVAEAAGEMWALDCLAYTYFAWDEDENVGFTTGVPWSFPGIEQYRPNLLPLETQEVNVDQFNMVDMSGWVMFLWPASNFFSAQDAWDEYDWYQTWMGVKYAAYGVYSAAMDAAVIANHNCFAAQVYPGLGINYPYIAPVGGINNTNPPQQFGGEYAHSWLY
jgi:hypothetical protein